MSEQKNETKTENKFFKNWSFLKKIKQVKHIGLIITIIFILILLLILFGDFNIPFLSSSNSTNSDSITTSSATYTTNSEYIKSLEAKLKALLQSVEGVGNVEVMISADGGQVVVASENETTTTKNSKGEEITTVSASPVIIEQNGTNSPLVIGEVLPEIKGVVVVSSGAKNVNVRLNIINVIQTLFNIDDSQIVILVGK